MGRVGFSSMFKFVELDKFCDASEGEYSRICDSMYMKWLKDG